MDSESLEKWLAEPRTALVEATARCVREHVSSLRSRGIEFYGYALLPGGPFDISDVAPVYNSESDITVERGDDEYHYYRYSVDEWAHYEQTTFAPVDMLLAEANETFSSLHEKSDDDDFELDEFQIAHTASLLGALLQGLEAAKAAGVFGRPDPLLVIWIPDSDEQIIFDSVRRLNSAQVVAEFMAEFGDANDE